MEIACEKHGWRRKRYGGKSLELACGKHRWIRDGGRDGRCGWERRGEKWKERYVGKMGEIAREKHRWRRGTGRDKRCGWEIGWEKWKERYGGRSVEIACAKHLWRRGTGRDGRGGWEIGWEKWKERTGGRSVEIACKSMGGGGSGMEDKRWGKRRTLRLGKTSGKVEGALCRKNGGKSSRKASVEKSTGRDGRCGWEIGWEKWKERYGGQI